jgi:hypothetical protein
MVSQVGKSDDITDTLAERKLKGTGQGKQGKEQAAFFHDK